MHLYYLHILMNTHSFIAVILAPYYFSHKLALQPCSTLYVYINELIFIHMFIKYHPFSLTTVILAPYYFSHKIALQLCNAQIFVSPFDQKTLFPDWLALEDLIMNQKPKMVRDIWLDIDIIYINIYICIFIFWLGCPWRFNNESETKNGKSMKYWYYIHICI
jgi:hypothetical protein